MLRAFTRILLTGFVTVVPAAVTIYALWWLGSSAEGALQRIVRWVYPEAPNIYGLGIACGIAVLFVVGLLMKTYVLRTLFGWAERLLEHTPLVKTLYGSVRDLMGFFTTSGETKVMRQVVLVDLDGKGTRLLGFITRDEFSGLPVEVGAGGAVAVYLPMSYQVGGFTVLVPRSALSPIDMTMEDAMRFAVTAGMSGQKAHGQ